MTEIRPERQRRMGMLAVIINLLRNPSRNHRLYSNDMGNSRPLARYRQGAHTASIRGWQHRRRTQCQDAQAIHHKPTCVRECAAGLGLESVVPSRDR